MPLSEQLYDSNPAPTPLGYYHRRNGGRIVAHMGFDDNGDWKMAPLLDHKDTFVVRAVDAEQKWERAEDFDYTQIEKQTCGRRMSDFGPQQRTEGLDYWEKQPNGNKTCSFCGSASWELFLEIIEKVQQGVEGYSVEQSDKSYKFYIKQPGVRNASEGAIKFYVHHVPADLQKPENRAQLEAIETKLKAALALSWEAFKRRYSDF